MRSILKILNIGLLIQGIGGWLVSAEAQGMHTLDTSLAAPGTPVLTVRAGADVFSEGVAADKAGHVFFNEMGANNRTMRLPVGQDSAKLWRQAKDAPNGMWMDTQNRLVICQAHAIIRVNPTAVFENQTDTLYKDSSTGANFNDVTGDSKDNFYFTNFNGRSVFFRDGLTKETKVVLSNRPKPNGIEWDEERKTIYVCENDSGKVASYKVEANFALTNRKGFAQVGGADGIVLDETGNVYVVSFGSGVQVFSPEGVALGKITISGSQLTNLAFGGADFKTLFMITNKGLYKLPMKVKGYKTGAATSRIKPFVTVRPSKQGFAGTLFEVNGKRIKPKSSNLDERQTKLGLKTK